MEKQNNLSTKLSSTLTDLKIFVFIQKVPYSKESGFINRYQEPSYLKWINKCNF